MILGLKSRKFHYQKLCRQQSKKAAQMLSWDLFAYTTERFVSLILLRITIHISICNHPEVSAFQGKVGKSAAHSRAPYDVRLNHHTATLHSQRAWVYSIVYLIYIGSIISRRTLSLFPNQPKRKV